MSKFKIFIALVIIGLLGFISYPYYTADTYEGVISGKEVKKIEGIDTYLVYLKDENGTPKTFKIKDSLAYLQYRSSDLFGSINNGDKVELKAYGLRIPLFSKYKNIYDINILESFNDKQLEILKQEKIIYFEKNGNIYSYDLNNKKLNIVAKGLFPNSNINQNVNNLNDNIKSNNNINSNLNNINNIQNSIPVNNNDTIIAQ